MTDPADQLAVLLEPADHVLVVLGPWVRTSDLPAALSRSGCTLHELTEPLAVGPAPDAVVLVVQDLVALRRVLSACRGLPASTRLGCVLLHGERPPLTTGRPTWPRLRSLTAADAPTCLTFAELEAPLPAGELVADLARCATPAALLPAGWPMVGLDRSSPQLWTPADPTSLVGDRPEIGGVDGDYPPDVLLVDAAGDGPTRRGRHPVLGDLADDVRTASLMTWSDYHRQGAGACDRVLGAEAGLGLGGFDEQVLNPTGFLRRRSLPVQALTPVSSSSTLCQVETTDGTVVIDSRHGVGETEIARLRSLQGVHVAWAGAEGPRQYCRIVVGLAMAGIPLTCAPPPSWARALIHPTVLDAVLGAGSLTDPLEREVSSIRLRRAAHAAHGAQTWRRELATRHGLQQPPVPRVSVLLATRRPDLLRFALRQVARQRGVDLQLVLAGHGHEPDRVALDELSGTSHVHVTSFSAPSHRAFGDVLNDAAQRADGDVLLKMDDDDWYGPDFVTDLLMARTHSGADIVGVAPEFVFVEPLGLTVRRGGPTERFGRIVAGGTMMISRQAHQAVGGFRSMHRHVDAAMLEAVFTAGGSVYRAHGHGYVLRRTGQGHTWDPGLGYFVSRSRTLDQWRGFRPSPLLEADGIDVPRTAELTDA